MYFTFVLVCLTFFSDASFVQDQHFCSMGLYHTNKKDLRYCCQFYYFFKLLTIFMVITNV